MNVRDSFFNEIYQSTKNGMDFVVVSADLGAPSLDGFRKDFPNRFVNVGIAEQNLLAVASGLQIAGKTAVAYGLNPFPIARAYDQVRNIMASLQIPITLAALNAGTCSADAGFSHMAIETVSMVRTLKNIRLVNPSDETIAKKLVSEIAAKKAPRIVQFDKEIEGTLYHEEEIDFSQGFVSSDLGGTATVVSYGIMAQKIIKAKLPCKLIDCFSLPINEEAFIGEIEESSRILTVEDGIACGGIGSMVLEILNDHGMQIPVKRLALRFHDGYPKEFTNRSMIFEREELTLARLDHELDK